MRGNELSGRVREKTVAEEVTAVKTETAEVGNVV